MYFKSRVEAGQKLASELKKYQTEKTAIVALSDGGVVVGAQIAAQLHCVITMLLIEPIRLPGEPEPVAVINQDGGFTYNHMYSTGQLEEFQAEYYHFIEQAKLDKLDEIHRLLGRGGLMRKELLQDHNIILVSDGLNSGFSLEAAVDFLKPLRIKRLIMVAPLASVPAVDRMHLLADEIHCLSVVENYMETNHYYEDNAMPSHEAIIGTIENIVENWHETSGSKTVASKPRA
ncbi:MAG TPA: phosphoribosyltransferase family protein [Candidatus Saccharimonadales bacterium]|nr:phosphoribosyltransferase family protein [Candidatus Saccharimonadales bacterium]